MKPLPKLHLLLLVIILAGCAGRVPTPSPAITDDPFTPTPSPTSPPADTPTITPTSTPADTPTATAVRTPPALPAGYTTTLLNPLDTPHTYMQDTCQVLQDKWSSQNSAPGTVVMPIMFHSITDGGTNSNQTSAEDFDTLMRSLHDNGFQAITMTQMAAFMEKNAKIPPRSVLVIADDRHHAEYFTTYFLPFWQQWQWPVVNAWISTTQNTADDWQEQVDLEKAGWVDHQAHGVVHNIPMATGTTDAYATSELQGSIDAFKLHFGKSPIAIVWPGGLFTHNATLIARQLGYQLGFTATPRGPVMFNWVPLDDAQDPARPSWPQDGYVNDPLLVIPRYWDTDAVKHINTVIQIGQQAADYANANKATELEYYDIVCAPKYGPLP